MAKEHRSFIKIAELVKTSRLDHPKKYSQAELSKLLGYKNGQFISNVERGICAIPLKSLQALCEVLNIDRAELTKAMIGDYSETIENYFLEGGSEQSASHA